MKNRILLICFCLFATMASKAQQDLTLFNFNDIPQSSYSNPANQFNGRTYTGLPFISSMYYSLSNSGFAYSDLIKKDGDSLRTDFNSMIAELEDDNFLSFNTKIDLLSIGFKIGDRTQIMLNATENINLQFNYTKDFATFIQKGNLGFADNTANFENIGFSANYYREFGLAISRQFGSKLRLGARFKYLYGIANLDSKRTDVSLTTDPNTYALTARADVLINTSGAFSTSTDSLTQLDGFISGNNNHGFGLDFGMNYEVTKKLSVNASVVDLGFINWGTNTTNYAIEDGSYTFSGIPVDAFAPQQDTSGTSAFDRISDSLQSAFNVKESNDGYSTSLVGRFYAGANYKMNEKLVLGGLIQSQFYKGNIQPSFTASANYKLAKWLSVAASYSMINRSFNNVGAGININPGQFQLYVVSDNILGGLRPQHARHAQVRAGINFIIGSEKVKEINPSFDGVTAVKEPKERKEKKRKNKELEQPETPVTPVVPETTKTDSVKAPIVPIEIPEVKTDSVVQTKTDSIIPKIEKVNTDSAKVPTDGEQLMRKKDSILQNAKDSTLDKIKTPKSEGEKTIIKAVEESREKMETVSDSVKRENEPMIHPEAPESLVDSLTPPIKVDSSAMPLDSVTPPQMEKATENLKPVSTKVDSVSNAVDSVKAKFITEPVKADSTIINDEAKSKLSPEAEALKKEVESAIEKAKGKTDSLPSPVESAPKKETPATEPN